MDAMHHPLNLTLDLYLQRMSDRGAFDHLEGAGKPLDLSQHAPSVLDKLMLESDVRPTVVVLIRQEVEIRKRLVEVRDPTIRKDILREIADVRTRIAIEIEATRSFR